ncbi:MAG: hypothetical protein OEU09_06610 [Rhodospirillales bacterium]|nr:hypothetical protein [Rhodospirillales bacterium]MDH3791066.1 hypothetical protein [Rhodospirillales bacterium]MDH3910953.1 hypothetical protein [Rhodospirillales bacterium]MDH3917649.1 hypothetical protein [Rhodospirillales bacterium]MDH3968344.1 hypothetical protein [Rhodospirillales bacterium]
MRNLGKLPTCAGFRGFGGQPLTEVANQGVFRVMPEVEHEGVRSKPWDGLDVELVYAWV